MNFKVLNQQLQNYHLATTLRSFKFCSDKLWLCTQSGTCKTAAEHRNLKKIFIITLEKV